MKKSLILILTYVLAFTFSSFAQEKDSLGNYDLKKLTYEDNLRLFGPITGTKINKIAGDKREVKDIIIKGNKITTILYNYGSICTPSAGSSIGNIADLVWNGLGYGWEFGVLAGAEVTDVDGNPLHIISDSHVQPSMGDYDAKGELKWGWLPKAGYSDPNQLHVASLNAEDKDGDGKPDSWPQSWYSAGAGKYLWPAFLGDMSTAPDEEVYYAMDDYTNYEFMGKYAPFPSDITKGGLGLDASVRILQFNNPMAEDIMFSVYQITNASEKDLGNIFFGMYGDPHIGGYNDYADDMSYFIPPKGEKAEGYEQPARSMVFSWDLDGTGMNGKKPGYFGWKFLESPSFANDWVDNDDDGIQDESPFNGKGHYIDGVTVPLIEGIADTAKYRKIYGAPKPRWSGDEDGDWDPTKHDVGIDGIGPDSKNYPGPDFGEGDGTPTQAWYNDMNGNGVLDPEEKATLTEENLPGYKWAGSEPNFGYRDISESDQLGLTGFTAAIFSTSNAPKNDELIWQWFTKPEIDPEQALLRNAGDNIFCFSTGPVSLSMGETQRFSMAIMMGENLSDLLLNASTSTKILEADYRFAQPPAKPIVKAVAGDHKVTLYWDSRSEESIDPLTSEKDFEGYKIYRSRDFNFSDIYKITDANGNPFLAQPFYNSQTSKYAQWDLVDNYSGLAEKEYDGRGVKYNLGSNSGLVHQYVDSTAQNGVTYYYAVVAYDRGAINKVTKQMELPPTETQAVIQQDPLTGKLIFDVNTVQATPSPVGVGYGDAEAGVGGLPKVLAGNSTGSVSMKVLDNLSVLDKQYKLEFADTLHYSVLDSTGVSNNFVSKDTVLVFLKNGHLVKESVQVIDAGNNEVDPSKYVVNPLLGQIGGAYPGSLPKGNVYTVKYRYYPLYQSTLINSEDGNLSFDGVRVYVQNQKLNADNVNSKFVNDAVDVKTDIEYPPTPTNIKKYVKLESDYEITWLGSEQNPDGSWKVYDSVKVGSSYIKFPFKIMDVTKNEPANFYLFQLLPGLDKNKQFDWGESIVLFAKNDTKLTYGSYEIKFNIDTTKHPAVLPKAGDIFKLRINRPFKAGDAYLFETKKAEYSPETAKEQINDIYVVPNPYVAYGISENPGRTTGKRGDRALQFRNLPPKCTIRIYTLTGELVDTINKDDLSSTISWDLLSKEGMRIAYGVYLYHVDIPGVGEKIGKFAVIK
ncbi:MAG: hypothetical protein HF314_03435 [Ignavibacteria bacterium]|jgi:hypothetical protein|nr:hypothetical protein [Ignavibacteria bacterium]MCU7502103.1 hypothetical protein [Ignavibacteria bacterium]MCU7515505.1 hypothetical protein [Ignavibacteria bacterium]